MPFAKVVPNFSEITLAGLGLGAGDVAGFADGVAEVAGAGADVAGAGAGAGAGLADGVAVGVGCEHPTRPASRITMTRMGTNTLVFIS